jgi:DNA-binding GntR family transcriptional regulator
MTSSRTGVTPIHKETQSLVDRVTDVVRQSIIDGRLPPGETVSISDLATDLGVSHSPVREALQRLSGQGLVELRPARTAIVTPLGMDDLEEIYRLCKLNEVDAVARACPNLTDEDIAELEAQIKFIGSAAFDTEEFWTAHDQFHMTLMRPVNSLRLERLFKQLWEARERYVRLDILDGPSPLLLAAADRHQTLLDVARTRDGEAMRAALLEHLEFNEQSLSKSLSKRLNVS